MANQIVEIPIEAGVLSAPPIYENRSDRKNWMAILTPKDNGRYDRIWVEWAPGADSAKPRYLIKTLKPGVAIEFGADNKHPKRPSTQRWYGVVVDIKETRLFIEHVATAQAALARALEIGGPEPTALQPVATPPATPTAVPPAITPPTPLSPAAPPAPKPARLSPVRIRELLTEKERLLYRLGEIEYELFRANNDEKR